MASASDHRAHAALQPADCLILLPQRLPAAAETSIGPAHYPAECTQSDAFLQPSLRARNGRANSNSFCEGRRAMIDDQKLHQFMGQMLSDLGGAASIALVRIGDSLGLYKTLHARGAMTAAELAAEAAVNERYLREWLSHQAASN